MTGRSGEYNRCTSVHQLPWPGHITSAHLSLAIIGHMALSRDNVRQKVGSAFFDRQSLWRELQRTLQCPQHEDHWCEYRIPTLEHILPPLSIWVSASPDQESSMTQWHACETVTLAEFTHYVYLVLFMVWSHSEADSEIQIWAWVYL